MNHEWRLRLVAQAAGVLLFGLALPRVVLSAIEVIERTTQRLGAFTFTDAVLVGAGVGGLLELALGLLLFFGAAKVAAAACAWRAGAETRSDCERKQT